MFYSIFYTKKAIKYSDSESKCRYLESALPRRQMQIYPNEYFCLMRMFQIPLVLIRSSFQKMNHFATAFITPPFFYNCSCHFHHAPVLFRVSPVPPPPLQLQSCSATYNIMHRGACAVAPQCKCHCATNWNVAETICRQVKGANNHYKCIH